MVDKKLSTGSKKDLVRIRKGRKCPFLSFRKQFLKFPAGIPGLPVEFHGEVILWKKN